MRTVVGLPRALADRDNAVLRPRDAATAFGANRWAEITRLVDNGVLAQVAPGYYTIVPRQWVGRAWQPDLHAVALGIAQADYGRDAVALTNVSAARQHGAIPRAVAAAAVAVPRQRPVLHTTCGTVHFAKRDIARVDVEQVRTELTEGWVTTVEQTLLDLAARPAWGGLDEAQTTEAIRALATRADWAVAEELAPAQHKVAALCRARLITRTS